MTRVTYFGHSCFLIETNGVKVLFDPFITPNELAKEIDLDNISCDYIFVSHGHWDHTADLELFANKTGAKVVGSWELTEWIGKKGISNAHPMNIGGEWDFGFAKVKMVFAAHSNSFQDGSYGGISAGYVFKNDETCFYYSGDTGLTMDMKLIAEDFKLDFAILPISSNFTMGINDAIKAAGFVNTNRVIGMHYDTFGYIKIDHEEAKQKFANKNIELTLMEIEEKIEI